MRVCTHRWHAHARAHPMHCVFLPMHPMRPQVADIAHAPAEQRQLADALQARAHVAAAAKTCIELDRNAAAQEAGYITGLFKVLGAEVMAKNDLIIGIPGDRGEDGVARWRAAREVCAAAAAAAVGVAGGAWAGAAAGL